MPEHLITNIFDLWRKMLKDIYPNIGYNIH